MEQGRWLLPKVEGLGPAPRGAHACVTVGQKVLVFGGSDRTPTAFNDLWVFDMGSQPLHWVRVTPLYTPGCTVVPRSGATLTAVGSCVYLFGGQDPLSGLCFNDVKQLDVDSWKWSEVEVVGMSPPPRHSHSTCCVSGACLVVFGGAGLSGPLEDVWLFNVAQGAWSMPTLGGRAPAAREMHAGVMAGADRMVVFGGRSADNKVLCDVAVLDLASMQWVAAEPTPFTRCAHSCVYLPLASTPTPAPHAVTDCTSADAATTRPPEVHTSLRPPPAAPPPLAAPPAAPPAPPPAAAAAAAAAGAAPEESGGVEVPRVASCGRGNAAGQASQQPPLLQPTSVHASIHAGGNAGGDVGTLPTQRHGRVLVYGGFSGEAVEGDLILLDPWTLEVDLVHRGPREGGKGGHTPCERFAHSAVAVVPSAWLGSLQGHDCDQTCMLVFGGVNPREDLSDVAVWVPSHQPAL